MYNYRTDRLETQICDAVFGLNDDRSRIHRTPHSHEGRRSPPVGSTRQPSSERGQSSGTNRTPLNTHPALWIAMPHRMFCLASSSCPLAPASECNESTAGSAVTRRDPSQCLCLPNAKALHNFSLANSQLPMPLLTALVLISQSLGASWVEDLLTRGAEPPAPSAVVSSRPHPFLQDWLHPRLPGPSQCRRRPSSPLAAIGSTSGVIPPCSPFLSVPHPLPLAIRVLAQLVLSPP